MSAATILAGGVIGSLKHIECARGKTVGPDGGLARGSCDQLIRRCHAVAHAHSPTGRSHLWVCLMNRIEHRTKSEAKIC